MLLKLSPSAPSVVDGIPAVTTAMSPIEINSFNFAIQIASLQISSVVTHGTDFTGTTPLKICILRSVSALGETPTIVQLGLNFDTTRAVDPDDVGTMIHFAFNLMADVTVA